LFFEEVGSCLFLLSGICSYGAVMVLTAGQQVSKHAGPRTATRNLRCKSINGEANYALAA